MQFGKYMDFGNTINLTILLLLINKGIEDKCGIYELCKF